MIEVIKNQEELHQLKARLSQAGWSVSPYNFEKNHQYPFVVVGMKDNHICDIKIQTFPAEEF